MTNDMPPNMEKALNRTLRRELRLANRERGKQGETIYRLRGEVALLRERIKTLQSIVSRPEDEDSFLYTPRSELAEELVAAAEELEASKISGLV